LKSTDQAVKRQTRIWREASAPKTIHASTKSRLGRMTEIHAPYKIAKGKTSKRHGNCFFLSRSTLSTTLPPTWKVDINRLFWESIKSDELGLVDLIENFFGECEGVGFNATLVARICLCFWRLFPTMIRRIVSLFCSFTFNLPFSFN